MELTNDTIKSAEQTPMDLPLAEEQAEETKAGLGRTRLIIADDQGVFAG